MGRTTAAAVAALAVVATACSGGSVVQTSDSPPNTEPSTSVPPLATHSNLDLANAFDYYYYGQPQSRAGYYFTTPSGKWRCAIVPHMKAGCQRADSYQSSIGIAGQPATVPDADGDPHPPNAIVVEDVGDAHFTYLKEADFWLVPGPAKTLPFNKILAAAGFRCNAQETGVSCLSETQGKGFTFSAEGYRPQYTDVPGGAPPP